jgi:hypothetical protein
MCSTYSTFEKFEIINIYFFTINNNSNNNKLHKMSKPLVLPKMYLRRNDIEIDMEDELCCEEVLLQQESPQDVEEIEDNSQSTKSVRKRQPTQYNIFIKETVALLTQTRPDLVGRERFKYAIHLWNEKKKTQT